MSIREDRNQDATIYLGNLDEKVTDSILFELCLQAGPVVNIHIPRDRVRNSHNGFGFCEFLHEQDVEYACQILNQVKLFGKPIRVNRASQDRGVNTLIGANLFVGNLDPLVDERVLYDTFSALGQLVKAPQVARDENGRSKGYGFVSYDSFETADAAIEAMNNQFLMNKPITVSYAFKREGKGERHGDIAERKLAAAAKKNKVAVTPQSTLPPGFSPATPAPTSAANTPATIAATSIPPVPNVPLVGATTAVPPLPIPNVLPFTAAQHFPGMPAMPMMNVPMGPGGAPLVPPPPPGMVMASPSPAAATIPGAPVMPNIPFYQTINAQNGYSQQQRR